MKITERLLILLILMSVVYGAFSFYWWSVSPGDWTPTSRGFFGGVEVVTAFVALLATLDDSKGSPSHQTDPDLSAEIHD
jgi:hypothetical protein